MLSTLLGFVLLLTPTGSLPSPRWRWWAGLVVAAAVAAMVLDTEPLDPPYQAVAVLPGPDGPMAAVATLSTVITFWACWSRPGRWCCASAAPAGSSASSSAG